MKLDFLSTGGGGGGSARGFDLFTPHHDPVPRPLDDASHVIRVGLIAAGLFFGLLIAFSLLAPISGAAIASGEVTTSGSQISIQPESGGVVTDVLVKEGQRVKAHQPLVRLNGVHSAAAAQQAQAKRDGLRALEARLIAERDGQESIAFPADLTGRIADPVVASAIASQKAIFAKHHQIMEADQALSATEKQSAAQQRTGASKQLALINDQLSDMQALYKKGFARKSQVRALQQAAAQLEAERATASTAVAQGQLKMARTAESQMMDIVTQLGEVKEELAQVDPSLDVTRYDASRDLLRAPVAGRVSGVAPVGPGSVLGAGETLMQIVPANRALIVEAMVRPQDIDDVEVGSPATLRFTTVNPRGKSSFEGKVITLSPARIPTEQGSGAFRAQIAVDDPAALERAGVTLKPGVPATVNIKTQDRTLFNYLFAPIEDAMSGGFREE